MWTDDKSNDVQSVAVKCLSILLRKVNHAQIREICDKLSSLLLDGSAALTDIYSIGLKTMISDAPADVGVLLANGLCGRLLNGISRTGSENVKKECMDILSDLLRRFGHFCESDHSDVMVTLVRQLEFEKTPIRKRAAVCLASLATVSTDQLLNRMIETILEQVDRSERGQSASADTQTLIQTVGMVSRTVGHRLGRHLPKLVPLFLRFCGDANDENQQSEAVNELRENCFPGLESFVLRCPREVQQYCSEIVRVCVSFAAYDPNYSYDGDGSDDGGDHEEQGVDGDDFDDEGDEDGGYSDDDDSSWKVRKNAVRVLLAVVQSNSPDSLLAIAKQYGGFFVSRFKEREENVRVDIIVCFNALLQGLGVVVGGLDVVRGLVSAVLTACSKQLAHTVQSPKTKSAVFAVLLTLVGIAPVLCLSTFLPIV